jgi:hypothetical protein
MKTNKWKSHTEIPGERDPVKPVSPKVAPRKRRKSDLTIGFVDSSEFVGTLSRQSQRAIKIDRMRQSAVSNQRATPDSQLSMIPTKSQLEAIKKLAGDPTGAQAIYGPISCPSHSNSRASGSRLTRTMTSGTFKKKYSGLAGQTGLRRISEPNAQRKMLMRKNSKSQFCPSPKTQASGNNQLSLEDSWEEEENQMPELDVLDEDEQDEQEMKSQKSNRTVEVVSDEDDRESDQGQEIKSIDKESEDNASRD